MSVRGVTKYLSVDCDVNSNLYKILVEIRDSIKSGSNPIDPSLYVKFGDSINITTDLPAFVPISDGRYDYAVVGTSTTHIANHNVELSNFPDEEACVPCAPSDKSPFAALDLIRTVSARISK